MVVSIHNLVYISVERYLAVVHPIYYKGKLLARNITLILHFLSMLHKRQEDSSVKPIRKGRHAFTSVFL